MVQPVNVIYLDESDLKLSTRAQSGRLSVDATRLTIDGDPGVGLPLSSVRDVELRRFQLGHMVRIEHQGGALLMAVYRLNLWGYFAIFNYLANRRLAAQLRELLA